MKLSDYIRERTRHHENNAGYFVNPPGSSCDGAFFLRQAQRDAEAAEAAGVKWDEETPALPEQVSLSNRFGIANAKSGDYLCRPTTAVGGEATLEGAVFCRAVVALWNAWGPKGTHRKKLQLLGHALGAPTFYKKLLDEISVEPWGAENEDDAE